jgi:hypothetical protein
MELDPTRRKLAFVAYWHEIPTTMQSARAKWPLNLAHPVVGTGVDLVTYRFSGEPI